MLDSMIDRPRSARRVVAFAACFVAILAGARCKKTFDDPISPDAAGMGDGSPGQADAAVDGPAVCNKANPAPTYTELYDKYFAVGKPGHCATEGCHGQVDFNGTWRCGDSKDTCYQGMVTEGLINKTNPIASKLGDPKNSPLKWVNQDFGFMPQDAVMPFPEGRDAIIAWIGACAQNN
jgi:hypothetical protein